ncbi:MAG: hypothetical protein KC583_15800 [Myxococcales bacterium]|nr:hypothetical protein [Myxococcales bacterium]
MVSRRLTGLAAAGLLALALSSCLSDPQLKTCADFPLGTAGCPAPCTVYCGLVARNCPTLYADDDGDDAAERQATCEAQCVEQLSDAGELGDRTGNTLQCRVTHAALAARDAATHCPNADLGGGTQCLEAAGEGCQLYCDLMTEHCAGLYPNRANCEESCKTFPGGSEDVDANTFECRLKYARDAALEGSLACEKASLNGGGVCGTPCEAYCDHVLANCSDPDDVLYADRPACMAACALLGEDGAAADWQTEMNTVHCRTYHASAPASFDSETHCPHAALYNDVHCGDTCDTYCRIMASSCSETYEDDAACQAACEGADPTTLFPADPPHDVCMP